MVTNPPPKSLTSYMKLHMSTLNEYLKRHFLAVEALALGRHSAGKVSEFFNVNIKTVYKGIREVKEGYTPPPGRIRRCGGGRNRLIPNDKELAGKFEQVISARTAGNPQDENIVWVSMTAPQIARAMAKEGCKVSVYIVRQLLDQMGFHRRSFTKDLPMKDVKDRNAQFVIIEDVRKQATDAGLPIISIDTKKKELIGNFKRDGKVMAVGQPKSLDHDFATFSDGQIVPHGIYDVTSNTGYMTIGTSHDTSKFVCDNIERTWEKNLRMQYPEAGTLVILCDGGGSNSSSHRIVKQDFIELASRINMNLLVMHYPPYCSKHNPIEHRLFSQITRSWSGAPLMSIEDAALRAAETTTQKRLKVFVDINDKTYDIQRPIEESFEKKLKNRVIFHNTLSKWNYLIKRS